MTKITITINVTGKDRKALKAFLNHIVAMDKDERPKTEKEWNAFFKDFFEENNDEFWEYFDEYFDEYIGINFKTESEEE